MFTVEEILEKASEYQRSRISLAEFDSWFEDNWEDDAALADHPALATARAAVDGALAQYYFDHIGETAFREELAAALRPFGSMGDTAVLPTALSSATTLEVLSKTAFWPATSAFFPADRVMLPAAAAIAFVLIVDTSVPSSSNSYQKKPPVRASSSSSSQVFPVAVAVEA